MGKAGSEPRVVLYDPSGHGGVCHYTYQLATSLARSGVDVTLLTTEGYELKHLERNFKLKFFLRRSGIKALAKPVLAKLPTKRAHRGCGDCEPHGVPENQDMVVPGWLKRGRLRLLLFKESLVCLLQCANIVHVQWLVDREEDYRFIRWLRLLGIKVVYTAHDLLPNTSRSGEDYRWLGRIYRQVDAVIVHGQGSKGEVVDLFNVEPAKVHVIPHGSNDLLCPSRELPKEAAKQRLGIRPTHRVILFFGIIKRYKGLEYLVEAFQEVKTHVPHSLLLVVGRIYDTDAEDFKYYLSLIDSLRCRGDVLCVTHYVPLESIGEYFAAADLVVLPYTKTYTSGVLLTAYAAGRPVVVTATGALGEIVEQRKSGLIVPPKDARALSGAITEMFNDLDLEAMGRYAKRLAEERYSWTAVASETRELYRALAA